MAESLHVLVKNDSPDLISCKEQDEIPCKALKESLINLLSLGHPHYQIPFFLFVHEKKGNALGVLTPKHENHHQPMRCYSQQQNPVAQETPPCLRAITAPALSVTATKEIAAGPFCDPLRPPQSRSPLEFSSRLTWSGQPPHVPCRPSVTRSALPCHSPPLLTA